MSKFDYVIVGAGTAGCVLANRLTEDPACSVLLLEAGGGDRHPALHVPKGFAYTIDNETFSWKYQTEPFGPYGQTELWSRGKVLGGSSSINGMVYNRGAQADYDAIEALGNPGWGWSQILPIFKQIEDHQLGASDMRGAGGPVHISVVRRGDEVSEKLLDSASALGLKRVDDINASDEERAGYTPANTRNGMRVSAAKAFLHPARKRPNLTVMTGTTATGLVFEGNRVTGVSATQGAGRIELNARREVILSLGSIATPQLLQLSGIGPREVLREAGVDVRVDSPQVGEGIREHRCFPLQMRLKRDIGYNRLLSKPSRQALSGMKYLLNRQGPLATPAYDMLAFLRSSPDSDRPDAQVLLAPMSVGIGPLDISLEQRPGLSLLGFVLRPTSLGSVHIRSTDPHALPRVVAGYLDTEHDRVISLNMFKRMRELVAQQPIADEILLETMPGVLVQDDEALLNSGFLNGGTGYHASGACAMGPNETDAIDSRLRVRGVQNLRVVDVSILPAMVAGNLNGPMMAMAWRAADMIREDA